MELTEYINNINNFRQIHKFKYLGIILTSKDRILHEINDMLEKKECMLSFGKQLYHPKIKRTLDYSKLGMFYKGYLAQ